ncbi:hypothetical protein [Halalkalibaculum sp. DA384]|uniref:hypothetical protein n=1 Tax=Halalkalibaculum sp. DA384 TaxID=3373606 RepID=UPI0037546EC8
METDNKKLELIRWLTEVEDDAILEQIEFIKRSDRENWNALAKEEQEAIQEGLAELERGEGIEHDAVINELRKKYSAE